MQLQEFTKDIRTKIANDRLKSAIQELQEALENSSLLNDILLLSARHHDYLKQSRAGIIDKKTDALTINQIRASLLGLVDEITEQDYSPTLKNEPEQNDASVDNKGATIKNQFNNSTFNNTTFN